MKKLLFAFAACVACILNAQADTYKIDPVHSSISFKVRHFFSDVSGNFTKFEGTIDVDPTHPEKSSVSAKIDATTIDTKNANRDKHLRSEDFFAVEKFPAITFQSKSVKQTGADSGDIIGDLTMHGVTKEIILHARFLGKGNGMGGKPISGWEVTSDPIKRSEYGLTWSKAVGGTAVVGEEVRVTIDVEADKSP
jgi:polyisoprenoid-binding protein YceI